jgi:hypothetical protein
VLLAVCPGSFAGVMHRVEMVPMGGMRVMRRCFVLAGVVMCRGRFVMARGVCVMLRRFPMMFC